MPTDSLEVLDARIQQTDQSLAHGGLASWDAGWKRQALNTRAKDEVLNSDSGTVNVMKVSRRLH